MESIRLKTKYRIGNRDATEAEIETARMRVRQYHAKYDGLLVPLHTWSVVRDAQRRGCICAPIPEDQRAN